MSDTDDPRLSAIYRRAPQAEPDGRTDRVIRAAAHRAVDGRRRTIPIGAWALAATLVLGVGIGWQLLLNPPGSSAIAPPAAPAPAVESAAAWSKGEPVRPDVGGQAPAVKRRESRAEASVQMATDRGRAAPPAVLMDGLSVEAARERDEAEAVAPRQIRCTEHWPAQDAARAVWVEAIARARAAGAVMALDCLELRYRELFGDDPPDG